MPRPARTRSPPCASISTAEPVLERSQARFLIRNKGNIIVRFAAFTTTALVLSCVVMPSPQAAAAALPANSGLHVMADASLLTLTQYRRGHRDWRGRRHWRHGGQYYGRRDYRRPYRRGLGAGAAAAAGAAGLATGALIGGALSAAQAGDQNDHWIAYCSQKYRSFDPASGTYLGYDGQRHRCR
ncbi:BA14K family protein [Methylobacterium sp.]|uniref:BA14K family protein n=1 Tax=Methylobacterium sp. TaxID=409 RepID=UPI00338FFC02